MYLDLTKEELLVIYEEIMTLLGAYTISVDLTEEEVLISLRNSFMKFEKEVSLWQLRNQFINVYGMPAGVAQTQHIAAFNLNLVNQITDWFASMNRVGGKIPWHKDYINLEPNRQVYFLDKESSKPYRSGERRIHRVMWYAKPEIFNSQFKFNQPYGDDVLYSNAWNFSNSGLNYGNSRLGFVGFTFDTILMLQAREQRNKILFSEFSHNLSGDVLELTPMPGSGSLNIEEGAKLFYYYWDERELAAGGKLDLPTESERKILDGSDNPNNFVGLTGLPPNQSALIANPLQMKLEVIPWSMLSPWAKTFIKEVTFAKCKYIQGAKWRKIQKNFASGEMEYEINFDYSSLISEAIDEENKLIDNLREDLKALDISELSSKQKDMVDNATSINKRNGRLWFIN